MDKSKLPVVIGLAIPIVMVLVLAAVIYLPRTYVKPQHDFVYVTGSYPEHYDPAQRTRTTYRVTNGHLETSVQTGLESDWRYSTENEPRFYRYRLSDASNEELTVDEAAKLNLDTSTLSPDGFEFTYANSNRNIFEAIFGERDYNKRVLQKGSVSVPLDLVQTNQPDYNRNIKFVGWIIP